LGCHIDGSRDRAIDWQHDSFIVIVPIASTTIDYAHQLKLWTREEYLKSRAIIYQRPGRNGAISSNKYLLLNNDDHPLQLFNHQEFQLLPLVHILNWSTAISHYSGCRLGEIGGWG
jgi:hypothetical protein